MARLIELTANDKGSSKTAINPDHVVMVAPDTFQGATRIMLVTAVIEVKETYLEVMQKINPN